MLAYGPEALSNGPSRPSERARPTSIAIRFFTEKTAPGAVFSVKNSYRVLSEQSNIALLFHMRTVQEFHR